MTRNSANTTLQVLGDKTAIGLSFTCILHCLFLPLLLILIPSNATHWVSDESFHHWMLLGVMASSVLALYLGFKKHQQKSILVWGGAGLFILLSPLAFGHEIIGEYGEKVLTVIGAGVIAIGHIKNYRTCRIHQCEC